MHCKRVAYDAGWLASLNRPNVTLISHGIVAVDETGILTSAGQHVEVDYIAWATGFEVSETGVGLNHGVFGEDGKELRQTWKEYNGAYGYLGVAVPRVPNYFAVLGPNAISQSWGNTINNNTHFIARIVRGIYDRDLSSIVVKDSVMAEYNEYINSRLDQTSLASPECGRSWYKDPVTGRLVAPAPWGASACRPALCSALLADGHLWQPSCGPGRARSSGKTGCVVSFRPARSSTSTSERRAPGRHGAS